MKHIKILLLLMILLVLDTKAQNYFKRTGTALEPKKPEYHLIIQRIDVDTVNAVKYIIDVIDMNDVDLSSLQDKDLFYYNSASGKWENGSAALLGLSTTSHNHDGVYEPVDATILKESEIDTEAEFESILFPVFTPDDGSLDDDDVTLADVQGALSNDFHNVGGVDDDVPEAGDFGVIDTEAEFESILFPVLTPNDGSLNDDDVTLADVQGALSNDFHNVGGVDDDVPEAGDFGVIDTEAEFESILFPVLTPNDGSLNDDDVTLADVQGALSNDFHNVGGVDDDVPDNDEVDPDFITGDTTDDNLIDDAIIAGSIHRDSETKDGDNVSFDDSDENFTATTVDDAISEFDDANGSGPNAADYKVNWQQIGNMPSGFADGTDDEGSGGGGTSFLDTVIVKTSDESVASSTTLQNDDAFQYTLSSEQKVYVRLVIFAAGVSAADIKYKLSATDHSYYFAGQMGMNLNQTNPSDVTGIYMASLSSSITWTNGLGLNTGNPVIIYLDAYIENDSDTDTLIFSWAQNTSNATATTVKKGSIMFVYNL